MRYHRRSAQLAVCLGLLALAGCGGISPSADSRHAKVSPAAAQTAEPVPAISGYLLRALWQRPLGGGLVVDSGLVLSLSYRPAGVEAVSAVTGSTRWAAGVPARLQAYGLVPGNGVVIVEAGREFGHAPALVTYGVTEYVALDLSSGRRLWTVGAPGHVQNPPIAISGKLVLTADLAGAITARQAATGDVLWRRQPPSDCWRQGPGPLATSVALAADQTRVAASFECAGYRALVQMLDPRTGATSWSWESPRQPAGAVDDLAVTGVASQGDVLLLTGQDAGPDAANQLARAIPRRYSWPTGLGPPDDIQVVLALDARTGQPRWIELGGQMVSFTLADGAICETVSAGLECRDDVTGAPTDPVLVTGQEDSAAPPIGGDSSAGITSPVAAVTVAPFRAGHVSVELVPIRGERPLGQADVGTGTSPATASHATEQPFVVAAGTLSSGRTLVLLRRVDLPNYPVLALEVASAPG